MDGRVSNDFAEGVNRKIKQTKRTAYDYKNWKTFIYRIRDWNQNRKKKPIRK